MNFLDDFIQSDKYLIQGTVLSRYRTIILLIFLEMITNKWINNDKFLGWTTPLSQFSCKGLLKQTNT